MRVRGELRALRFVDNRHERFERGFVIEEIVLVDLVRSDDDFDVAGEIHPGHVAVAVVAGGEGVGAQRQKTLQRRIVRDRCRLAQFRRGRIEEVFVERGVRSCHEVRAVAADDCEETFQLVFLGRMRGHIALEFFLGDVGRIERRAGRLLRGAGERFVVF
jgi:hypothetical protein